MLNTVYQIVAPREIVAKISDLTLEPDKVVVKPTYLSICHADQRYYQGKRPKEILDKKFPMALIHEGIGEVVMDPTGTFQEGDTVVMIPNFPTEKNDVIAENYLRSSKFRASSMDGFTQEYIASTPDRFVKLPDGIDHVVAAFTELVSVSYHAVSRMLRFSHSIRDTFGVWGDGNLGFITALVLKKCCPESKVLVFGIDEYKLSDFAFADGTYLTTAIPDDLRVDHAFECVGNIYSGHAINQIIDYIHPEGTISILGVSEEPVPINTRMVLEKGLRFFGSSRSGRADYEGLLALYEQNPDLVNYLESIVGSVIEVNGIEDIDKAFEEDIVKRMGKTVMKWNL